MRATELAAKLADMAEEVAVYLLPNGRRVGREWKAGSVHGEAGDSLGVCLYGDKRGQWADWAGSSDESGDLIGLWQRARGVDLAGACAEAERFLGLAPSDRTKPNGHLNGHAHAAAAPERVTRPAPPDNIDPSLLHGRYGAPTRSWRYLNAIGETLGFIRRFDPPGERKQIVPLTYSDDGWRPLAWSDPRPLYGLDELARRPNDHVLIVEGEKCVDAARSILRSWVVVTWPGGAKAVAKADWSVLRGRSVTAMPDADAPGRGAMHEVARCIGQRIRLIDTSEQPDGWDIADAVAEGWTGPQFARWSRERVSDYDPEPTQPDMPHVSDYQAQPVVHEEPIDLFEKIPLPPLNREHLPPEIADYVFDQGALIGADPCMVAISCLVATAAVMHDSIKLQPKRHDPGWTESARIWGMCIGDPSKAKTPCIAAGLNVIEAIDYKLRSESAHEHEIFKKQLRAFENSEKAASRNSGRGMASGHPGDAPQKPPSRALLANDITPEKLGMLMNDNPGGMIVYRDELAGFFGGMDGYSASKKDAQFWLQAYNGKPYTVDRVTRESLLIRHLSVCVIGGIQPDRLVKVAKDLDDDGMLQRFIPVIAQDVDASSGDEDRPPDQGALTQWQSCIDWLASERPKNGPPITMSDGALTVRMSVEKLAKTLSKSHESNPRLQGHLGKWRGLFARLCLIYHGLQCANMAVPVAGEVSTETAQRVARFMIDYLYHHTRAMYDMLEGDRSSAGDARRIAALILRRGLAEVTYRDVYRHDFRFRSMSDQQRAYAFTMLVYLGWLDEPDKRADRTPKRFIVNPLVHERFAHLAGQFSEEAAKAKRVLDRRVQNRKTET